MEYVEIVTFHKIIMVIGGQQVTRPQQQYHIPSDRITNHILGDGLLIIIELYWMFIVRRKLEKLDFG